MGLSAEPGDRAKRPGAAARRGGGKSVGEACDTITAAQVGQGRLAGGEARAAALEAGSRTREAVRRRGGEAQAEVPEGAQAAGSETEEKKRMEARVFDRGEAEGSKPGEDAHNGGKGTSAGRSDVAGAVSSAESVGGGLQGGARPSAGTSRGKRPTGPNAKQPLGRAQVGAATLAWLGRATERLAAEYMGLCEQTLRAAGGGDDDGQVREA
jgi:hypothetical protein